MPDFTFRSQSITIDPQTITFASLSASLEGRSLETTYTTAPVVIPIPKSDRVLVISSTTTTGFTVDASDFGVDLPITIDFIVRTFDTVSSASNAKSATVSRIRRLLQITGTNELLTDTDIQERVDDATVLYSKHNPRIGRSETIGNDEYEQALPTDWVNDFSVLRKIEYPAGDQRPDYIDDSEIRFERADTTSRTIASASTSATSVTASTITEAGLFKDGELVIVGDDNASETNWIATDGISTTGVIAVKNALDNTYDASPYIKKKDHVKFFDLDPNSTEYFVFEYTLPHTHTDSLDTIPSSDYEALSWLGASLCAWSISAEFGKGTSSGFDADSVNLLTNAEHWRNLAEDYEKRYNKHVGADEDSSKPAVMPFVDVDVDYTHGRGTQHLFHDRGGRNW